MSDTDSSKVTADTHVATGVEDMLSQRAARERWVAHPDDAPSSSTERRYVVRVAPDGARVGPLPVPLLARLLRQGTFGPQPEVCLDGADAFCPVLEVEDLRVALEGSEPPEAGREAFGGPLDGLGAGPTLLRAAREGRTGFLSVHSGGKLRVLSLHEGRPLSVESTAPEESLEAMLLADERVWEKQLQRARAHGEQHGVDLMTALVETKAIGRSAVIDAKRHLSEVRALGLLSCSEGTVRFEEDLSASASEDGLTRDALVLCREAAMARHSDALLSALGGPNCILSPTGAAPSGDTAATSVLSALVAPSTVSDLLEALRARGVADGPALCELYLLAQLGQISVGRAEDRAARELCVRLESGVRAALALETGDSVALEAALAAVREQVGEAAATLEPASEVRRRLMAALSALEARFADPVEREVLSRAFVMRLDPDDAGVRAAIEPDALGRFVTDRVRAGDIPSALPYAERHFALAPEDPSAQAYVGLCRALGGETPAQQADGLALLTRVTRDNRESFALQLALGQAALHHEDFDLAARALSAADKLKPGDALVAQLSQRVAKSKKGKRHNDEAAQLRATSEPFAAVGWALLTGVGLWALACRLGLGAQEYLYSGTDGFWYARRGILIGMAMLGFVFVRRESPLRLFSELPLATSVLPLVSALAVGLLSGFLSPAQGVTGSLGVVLGLAALHVVAEQLFFIGFVGRTLIERTRGGEVGAAVTAALYGAYHLSYYSFFVETQPRHWMYWLMAITLGGGLPYALLYRWSRSILPSLLCHLVVMELVFVRTVLSR